MLNVDPRTTGTLSNLVEVLQKLIRQYGPDMRVESLDGRPLVPEMKASGSGVNDYRYINLVPHAGSKPTREIPAPVMRYALVPRPGYWGSNVAWVDSVYEHLHEARKARGGLKSLCVIESAGRMEPGDVVYMDSIGYQGCWKILE